jgi:uncharacterized membrane protein
MLSKEAKETPYWRSWVAHVRLLEMTLRQEYSLADVKLLDELVLEHHKAFLKVCLCNTNNLLCNTMHYTTQLHNTWYTDVTHRVTQHVTQNIVCVTQITFCVTQCITQLSYTTRGTQMLRTE